MSLHPHQERTKQNEHIMDTSAVAHRGVMQLTEKGFTVLSVHIETRNPVVWIQNCARCSELKALTKVRRNGPMGKEVIMAAQLHGCQVQWIIRGH